MTGSRPRAVVFAYACDPGRGSEPGAGWGVVRALAAVADCTVLLRPDHAQSVLRWAAAHPGDAERLRGVVVPEAGWAPRGRRGRLGWFAAYLGWLPNAGRSARRLHAERPFDLACHATYSVYWLPTPATALGVPCVWGPVGGAVTTPAPLWPALGWRGAAAEAVDRAGVRLTTWLPATRRTWRRATTRVLQNAATRDRLPADLRAHARVLNHALFTDVPPAPDAPPRGRELLWAGALEARKGAGLAIRAVACAPPDVCLAIAGDGPERRTLERLAARLGVAGRVTFLGAVPRAELFALLDRAAAAVFTGLREEGGLALAEAMLRGTPVVVLANGGARTIAERCTDPSRVALVAPGAVDATARGLADAMTRFSRAPSRATGPTLDQAAAVGELGDAVRDALLRGAPPGLRHAAAAVPYASAPAAAGGR